MTTHPMNGFRVHQPPTPTFTEPATFGEHAEISDAGTLAAPQQSTSDHPQANSHEHVTATTHKPWPLVIIGLAAAVAVWSGWIGLGQMAGFGVIHPLPGIWDDLTINTVVVLPLSLEAYAAYALRVWLGLGTRSKRTIKFARRSAIASLGIGAVAQVAYHLMSAAGYNRAPWPMVALVATVPVIVLGLASALAKMVTADIHADGDR